MRPANKGIINFIMIVVILVIILSLLKVNLRGYIDSDSDSALRGNVSLIVETGKIAWTDYIRGPIVRFWTNYAVPFMTGEFLGGLKTKLESGRVLPPG